MSKVISFSISDKYLEKLRTLYPSLTDNLAAKQFLTDGLESSLGNSLDGSLDDGLDGKLKTLIESELDGLLDDRLDATVGKLITSLSERMARLEERLDDSLDGRLDDMERLLRLQREASIASPIPTGEPSPFSPFLPPDKLGEGGNGDIFPDSPPSPLDRPAIKTLTSESDSSIEGEDAIETLTPEVSSSPPSPLDAIETAIKVKPRRGYSNSELSEKLNISKSTIEKWKARIQRGEKFEPKVYPNFFDHWLLYFARLQLAFFTQGQ
ncbi:MAG: hypothetical protein ACKN87_16190 [Microcystis aeruginosa]